jgi:hypothetical protein
LASGEIKERFWLIIRKALQRYSVLHGLRMYDIVSIMKSHQKWSKVARMFTMPYEI